MCMMKKFIGIVVTAAVLTFASGCSSNSDNIVSGIPSGTDFAGQNDVNGENISSENAADEIILDQSQELAGVNPLTGESGYNVYAAGKRPVAVMVNNLKAALPQYGIDQADIIYELPVEGGITRLMAVYADYTSVPDICSVRSCRYYYPIICLGMDAIYCHWGSDKTIALDTLNRTGIDHLDGEYEGGLFYRDADRAASYASEHTGYLCGAELAGKIAEKGFRTDIAPDYAGAYFNFAPEGENASPAECAANSVTVNFSDEYFSTFNYDVSTGQYMKLHSGTPHVDGRSGVQLGFENVFVLQTNVYSYDGYLMSVDLNGGTGYYISNGGAQAITWSKPSENAPITMYALDGTELLVNVGESYIGIIGSDKYISIS